MSQPPQLQHTPTLAHSFSRFELFDTCPKQFFHRHVKKDLKEEESEASLAGTRDHKSFELRLKEGLALPPHLKKHEEKCEIILGSGMEVKAEEELAIDKELKPCDWWHRDVFLRVKADVTLYSETTAGLLDWKTGKRKPKNFQLELGAMTQFLHYPKIKSTKAAFLWLRDDATDQETYTRDKDFERILTKTFEKADRIEEAVKEDVWQAKPGYHCNWCGLKDTCTSSQARR